MTVALLLPITFTVPPASAFIMFAGIYYGGMYGGSTTSILLNTPGESSSMITALEGNKMARRGPGGAGAGDRGDRLLRRGHHRHRRCWSSRRPLVVDFAISFGPEDYFALAVLAFTAVSSVLSRSVVRGLASLGLGLVIGLIGIDQQTGQARLTLGIAQLLDGIDVVIVAVGLFAVGEVLYVASRLRHGAPEVVPVGRAFMGRVRLEPLLAAVAARHRARLPVRRAARRRRGDPDVPVLRGGEAAGPRVTREEFGKGAIEGVAGPEAANNASAAGTLVPLLTLGLPTSATAAILLAAFQQYGLQPGPQLFDHNPALVWGMIASLFIGNAMLLVLNLPLAPPGPGCCTSRARTCTPGSCCSPRSASTR